MAATPVSSQRTRRIGVLVNPTSGKGYGRRAGAEVVARLRARGHHLVDVSGQDAVQARQRAVEAMAGGLDALVVVGGDGVVQIGTNVVAGTGVPLGIVPAGTGNDVARGLGLPLGDGARAEEMIHSQLVGGTSRSVDAVRAGDGWFAGVLGGGFDALVNERANTWTWPRGRMRYNLAIARELPVFRPIPYELELDGETWSTSAMLVAVANAPSYGAGMRICPDASMDDGLLDVLVLEPISRLELLRVFPRVYSGRHVSHRAVTVRRATSVTLRATGIVAYADGERIGELPLTCTAVPGALHVLAPKPF